MEAIQDLGRLQSWRVSNVETKLRLPEFTLKFKRIEVLSFQTEIFVKQDVKSFPPFRVPASIID